MLHVRPYRATERAVQRISIFFFMNFFQHIFAILYACACVDEKEEFKEIKPIMVVGGYVLSNMRIYDCSITCG